VRALKILVVVMGVMLVAGVAILVATIAMRTSQPRLGEGPLSTSPIELPAGAHIEAMSIGGDRLVIAIVLPDGNRQLHVLDLVRGRTLGVIPLRTAP
jgi:hypothetical protein